MWRPPKNIFGNNGLEYQSIQNPRDDWSDLASRMEMRKGKNIDYDEDRIQEIHPFLLASYNLNL